ncbi:putative ornithine decarboxylase [Leishmania major strain Friedlin]|uniref:ornithine decarboxylase n=1 Tax=Leishmania major TaxID=5664 RepID=Q4QGR5_LEIMA|nr:putative ornithine decarboxylase [Leishmania major strain Friedlin]CAG9570434.1 ornithine_decarboxylase_-_putative [Leishmania major strain Friedlin]CAJ02515.1 putative ornithine decarboxylase [Leishmania major strain Friedlin]|eukprot:XP_001681633.1 putative ornithine decarboxylase [Leishmania major strain Friedlin]
MGDHDVALCQVSHYNHANYWDFVPLPTVTDDTGCESLRHNSDSERIRMAPPPSASKAGAAEERLPPCERRLLDQYHIHLQPANRNPLSRADSAAGRKEAAETPAQVQMMACVAAADSTADQHAPVAATQDLVDLFFLEGSQAVDGLCFSPYPIYGWRTAEERRAAVCEVFKAYNVVTRLPASPAALAAAQRRDSRHQHSAIAPINKSVIETREQYWRRLSNLYIQKGVKDAAAAADAATTTATNGAVPAAPAYEPEDPFYIIDLGRVVEQMARWRHELPMVRPYFAVKSNPQPAVLEVLSALGAGFDCASKEEIHMVLGRHLVASPDDIIFANPCKQLGDLCEAQACGVTYVTVDNPLEMEKIGRLMPSAHVIIRIKTNDSKAQCCFSTKFGAPLEDVDGLLKVARQLNVAVCGVSFHVGSGNDDQSAYLSAVRDAYHVFQQAAQYGFKCTLLDIGGGFPGTEVVQGSGNTSFEIIARTIRPVLAELFGGGDVTIISEPGRYFTAASHALLMNVFASRTLRLSDVEVSRQAFQSVVSMDEPEEYQYYVNDGLYHSFNCILYDHAHPTLLLLNDGDGADGVKSGTAAAAVCSEEEGGMSLSGPLVNDPLFVSAWDRRRSFARRPLRMTTIFGPTCDSMDCILKKQPFPEMKLGDWLLVPDMGSYTTAAAGFFNGFATRRREWVSSVNLCARPKPVYTREGNTLRCMSE